MSSRSANANKFVWYVLSSLLFCVGLFLVVRQPNDTDNFYHLAHSDIYWQNGIMYRPFPWASYSVISQYKADLWWGFHVLLVPFSLIADQHLRILIVPCVLVFIHLVLSGWSMVMLRLSPYYGFVLLLGSSSFLSRMDTVRPQALSSALLLWIFACLFTKRPALALVGASVLGFLHPTLSYMLVPILLSFCFITREKSRFAWSMGCLAFGLGAAALRPGIKDGLQLMKIQLVDLFLVRRQNIIQNFGAELDKVDLSYFMRSMALPLALLILSLLFLLRKHSKGSYSIVQGALVVTLIASTVCFFVTRRGVDQFVPFCVLTAVLLIKESGGFNWVSSLLCGTVLAFSGGNFVDVQHGKWGKVGDFQFEPAAKWLARNTPQGTIIGQSVWSDFGPLLYFNKHNRYFGGMDPIFQYKFDEQQYWRMTLVAKGRGVGETGATNPLSGELEEPVSKVFPRDLKTSYVVISKNWNTALAEEIRGNPDTSVAFEDQNVVIFKFGALTLR